MYGHSPYWSVSTIRYVDALIRDVVKEVVGEAIVFVSPPSCYAAISIRGIEVFKGDVPEDR